MAKMAEPFNFWRTDSEWPNGNPDPEESGISLIINLLRKLRFLFK
jgi:hypothetical protein